MLALYVSTCMTCGTHAIFAVTSAVRRVMCKVLNVTFDVLSGIQLVV